MDFVHTADLHLGKRQYGLDQRFIDYGKTFLQVIEYAVAHKTGFVLVSGDLFDQRNINAPTYIQANHVLLKLKEAGIPCIAIEGNHDKPFLKDGMSWLESLEWEGLIKVIKPGSERLMDNYVDVGDTRIFGMCFAGSMTSAIIPRIREEILQINAAKPPAYTILMMHLGVEGKVKGNIIGEVNYETLAPLKECVNYLALGHYHNAYDIDGWVYNPGSPDTCSISEVADPKGFYHVMDGAATLHQADIRKFIIIPVNVDSFKDAGSLTTALEKQLLKYSNENAPMVNVIFHGTLNFDRSHIDVDQVKALVSTKTRALYADVRFDLLNDEFSISKLDSDSLDRPAIEREIFRKLALSDSMLAGHSEFFTRSITEIKDLAVRGADERTLDDVIRKLFEEIKHAPPEPPLIVAETPEVKPVPPIIPEPVKEQPIEAIAKPKKAKKALASSDEGVWDWRKHE
jgi:DNA repair exonuclease SbcCD nuclease subunit